MNLSVSVSDLSSASHLKKLIQGEAKPVFTFGSEIAPYWNGPISNVPNQTAFSVSFEGDAKWKTSGLGINFGLSESAKCQLKVIKTGPVLTYAADLQSQPTSELPATPYAGYVYLVLSLDFQIGGNVGGSGTVQGLGISGNVKGSTDTSVVFCHSVSGSMTLSQSVEEAFEKFVFPFEPTCAKDMTAGDLAQINFNGSLGCSLDVSYGIANVGFSAPGVASALDSVTQGAARFTLPSGKIEIGADASISYTHTDDFTAIVQKQSPIDAFLYVMRAHKNDESEGLKLSAEVKITSTTSVTVDSQKLQHAINSITGVGGEQAAACATEIAQGLTNKLNDWVNDTVSKGASLGVEWDQHQAVSALFKYEVNLPDSDKLLKSWNALCAGNLRGAANLGGLIPEPGSGIAKQMSHSFTMGLHFFNLFAASTISTYFEKTYISVTPGGDLRYMFDIGKEMETDVNKSKKTCLFHFVATVDQATALTVTKADVELVLELVANDNQREAHRIGDVVGFIPPDQQVNQAQKAMQLFAANHPSGTLDLVCILKPSAYGRLSCSEYNGTTPPTGQQQDSENWQAFHDASVPLLNLPWAEPLSYQFWQQFNEFCVYGVDHCGTPDRRSEGNPNAVPSYFFNNLNAPPALIGYFLLNTADFMNLCDDLHRLAGLTSLSNNAQQDMNTYNRLLESLVELIVKRDVNTDYSKPAVAALLRLTNPQSVECKLVEGGNALTCTLTLN